MNPECKYDHNMLHIASVQDTIYSVKVGWILSADTKEHNRICLTVQNGLKILRVDTTKEKKPQDVT